MLRNAKIIVAACMSLVLFWQWATADPIHWPTNGHWYEAPTVSTYAREQALAAVHGMSWMGMPGHLATITSQEEQDFIASWIPAGTFWIAGYQDPEDSAPSEGWHWTTAETWGYTNWSANEPNDFYGAGVESCLELYSPGMGWNDVRCIEAKYLLVEYDGLVPVATTTWGAIKSLFGLSSD
jgi:hypothetical protein